MAQRFVMLVDHDTAFTDAVIRELGRRNYRAEAIEETAQLLARKTDLPDLIILCVDPKPAGWAHSDRVRKADHLKNIPLIVTSADALPEDFDKHAGMKRPANDYQHKPITPAELLQAVVRQIGTSDESQAFRIDSQAAQTFAKPEPTMPLDHAEQVMMARNDMADTGAHIVEEKTAHTMPPIPEMQAHVMPPPVPPEHMAPPVVEEQTVASMPVADVTIDAEAEAAFAAIVPTVTTMSIDESQHTQTMVPSQMARPNEPVKKTPVAHDIDLGLDSISTTSPKMPPQGGTESGFSREREFLNLRETINRKEREVIDLKETCDQKDRQMLDMKDKLRESERRERDLDSAQLEGQKELVGLKERLSHFETEYNMMRDREQKMRAMLDQIGMEKQAVETELASWQTRHANDTSALNETISRKETEWKDARIMLQTQMQEQSNAKMNELKTQWADEQKEMSAKHATQLDAQRMAMTDEKASACAELSSRHKQDIDALLGQHAADMKRMSDEQASSVMAMDAQRAQALEAQKSQLQAERDEMIVAARQSHQEKLRALEEAHESLKAATADRHTAAMNELQGKLQEATNNHARALEQGQVMVEQNKMQEMRMQELRGQLANWEARVKDRDQRINDLEQEAAMYQDQILKAYQRIRSDEDSVTRAKRALAIALGVLDEPAAPTADKSKS